MIIDIVKSNFKIIIFGFVFTFFSSIGQSFFIGLFNSEIRAELNITHGEFGTIYGAATLCSSLTLIWLGKKIDELKLVNYSILVTLFLFIAALFFSFVNTDNNKSEGYSINKNLKKGMITIASIIVRKMNPLIHLAKYINPLSIGELISKENASNSFSYEKER